MKKISKIILLLFFCLSYHETYAQELPFKDTSLTFEERVKDLVSRLSLEEKIQQMTNDAPAIPRLQIPAYNWWNEALHGVGRSGKATVFPQAIGFAATFDTEITYREASVISDEARAMYNEFIKAGKHLQYGGLTFWTPNINIFRDPRWGRGQETYGEDPYLTSQLGVAFVKGMQGNHPTYLKTSACAKHFAVHSGPEKLRHEFDAKTSMKDLWETYLPAFRTLVDSGVSGIMCAYNKTNGQPCCGNTYLLMDILRKQWKFTGYVTSDCGALEDISKTHKYVTKNIDAAVLAAKNGVNLDCGTTYKTLLDAVNQQLISEKTIDSTLTTLFLIRFKLGMFDPENLNPYNRIPYSVVNSFEHRALSREVAQKSLVLLKNNGVLPLKKDLKKYFVTGANASNIDVLLGNYYGMNEKMVTFLEGIIGHISTNSQIQYRPGVLLYRENSNPANWAVYEAKNSDVTIVVMGISSLLEGEEGESVASPYSGDRLDYNIPQNQIDYLAKIRKKNTKPIIAVITGGSPMNLSKVDSIADAVLMVWYPGEEGGNAAADVIFGDVSPAGRLPITFPKSLNDLPAYENYAMKGRTYRYMQIEPLYPFGFGLSYTNFSYSNLVLSKNKITKHETVELEATVTNTGNVASDEVVQLYLSYPHAGNDAPLYSLKGFRRIHLAAGKSEIVKFKLTPEMMSLVNENGESVLNKGTINIYIAGSLPSKRSLDLGAAKPLETLLIVK